MKASPSPPEHKSPRLAPWSSPDDEKGLVVMASPRQRARRGLRRPKRIETPGARPGGGQEQPEEAEEHDDLAPVQDGPEAPRRMRDEVGDRHLAGQEKGDRPGEQAQ